MDEKVNGLICAAKRMLSSCEDHSVIGGDVNLLRVAVEALERGETATLLREMKVAMNKGTMLTYLDKGWIAKYDALQEAIDVWFKLNEGEVVDG